LVKNTLKTGRLVVWWAGAWNASNRYGPGLGGSVLQGGGEPCQLCVGSSSDVGSCDVRCVVRLAFLLPVSGSVALDPDVRVVLVRRVTASVV
jgi:hypothetical protein